MNNISFKNLRDQLSDTIIKELLFINYEIVPFAESTQFIVFPTCCHNLMGGSNKLYYYKNTHMFKCYTECGMFDIFELFIKMEELRGNKIGKHQAIIMAGLKVNSQELDSLANETIIADRAKLYEICYTEVYDVNNIEMKPIDIKSFENRFSFNMDGLQTWLNEKITALTMFNYGITYDIVNNCIIIPHQDRDGNVVGVRGRFLDPEATAKYKPITYNGVLLSHPKSKTLYGYYQNKEAIKMAKTAIIVEGEKSVLKLDSMYGDDKNIAVAVCGTSISREQIQLLVELGISNVIIGFDADYTNTAEREKKIKEYTKTAKPLTTFFNVSLLIDMGNRLSYKDSPVDKGKEIFVQLMKERINI